MQLIKPGTQFDFMGMRKYFYALSATLFLISLFAIFVKPGPNWGTDFKGGTEVEVTLVSDKTIPPAAVREVEESDFAAPDVVSSKDVPNRFVIRVQEVSALSEDAKSKLNDALCFSEAAIKDTTTCPESAQPTEVKYSPGGDKISLRYEQQPDLTKLGKTMGAIGIVQLRPSVEEGWPATREDYEKRYGALGAADATATWPATADEFTQTFGFPPGSVTTLSAQEKDHKIEIHLKSKGDQIIDGLTGKLHVSIVPETASVQWIGPKSSDDLRNSAFKAIFIALFFIMAYIAVRFDLRFAPGAIVSLAHDVLIAIGAMCLVQKEISLSTIAAVLTVLGYSITDTVVVYDRIRENLGKHRNMTFSEIVNLSVSEMFGRTLLTSGTAALSMVCFLIFGTQVIKDFAFVFLIGVAVGTYSSIYVAAPLTEWIDRRFFAGKGGARAKPPRQRAQKQEESVV
jgi:preprotein translocase subunit SecF